MYRTASLELGQGKALRLVAPLDLGHHVASNAQVVAAGSAKGYGVVSCRSKQSTHVRHSVSSEGYQVCDLQTQEISTTLESDGRKQTISSTEADNTELLDLVSKVDRVTMSTANLTPRRMHRQYCSPAVVYHAESTCLAIRRCVERVVAMRGVAEANIDYWETETMRIYCDNSGSTTNT